MYTEMVDLQRFRVAAPPTGSENGQILHSNSPRKPAKPPKPPKPPKTGNATKRSNGMSQNSEAIPWVQRKVRMEKALAWLKSEMESLRIYDKLLEAQFHQVKATIDNMKRDREEACRRRRSLSLDTEMDEEEEHWEDWEIKEFEAHYEEELTFTVGSHNKISLPRDDSSRRTSDT